MTEGEFFSSGSYGDRGQITGDRKKSLYNSAISQLWRLDQLWIDAHTHARAIAYTKWNEDLDRIWLELIVDSEKTERKKIRKVNKALIANGLYGMNEQFRMNAPALFAKTVLIQKRLLMKKESILRRIQDASGKGSRYYDPTQDDLL